MAPARRPRGTLIDPTQLGWAVERASKDRFDAIADRLEISSAVFFERVVEHHELDERGVPVWWTYPVPSTDGELPIDEA